MNNKKNIIKLKKRLLKLWSEIVREDKSFTCIYCGAKRGENSKSNTTSKIKIDAHHILQKEIKNCPLKYDIRNSAVLCVFCHKYGFPSAHKAPIVFYDWFRLNYPENYEFILKNGSIRVNLDNLDILKEIESKLLEKKPLDLELLIKMDQEAKMPTTTTTTETITKPITSL